jgi:hypothetical protein
MQVLGAYTKKEKIIRSRAIKLGKRLLDLQILSGVSRSVFYRVVKGTATSRRVDCFLANELGLNVEKLRSAK